MLKTPIIEFLSRQVFCLAIFIFSIAYAFTAQAQDNESIVLDLLAKYCLSNNTKGAVYHSLLNDEKLFTHFKPNPSVMLIQIGGMEWSISATNEYCTVDVALNKSADLNMDSLKGTLVNKFGYELVSERNLYESGVNKLLPKSKIEKFRFEKNNSKIKAIEIAYPLTLRDNYFFYVSVYFDPSLAPDSEYTIPEFVLKADLEDLTILNDAKVIQVLSDNKVLLATDRFGKLEFVMNELRTVVDSNQCREKAQRWLRDQLPPGTKVELYNLSIQSSKLVYGRLSPYGKIRFFEKILPNSGYYVLGEDTFSPTSVSKCALIN